MRADAAFHPTRDRRLGYRPALDGLRAVAITAVVLYHATDFTFPASGLAGVDLFFVLSGFLITTVLLEEHSRRGTVSLRGFYRRRAWRLLPAVFVLLALFLAASIVIGTAVERAFAGVAAGVFYYMNFVLAAGNVDDMPFGLTHLWSLAAEEQFYVLWPLLLLLVFRARIWLAIAACAAGVVLTQLRALELVSDHASGHRVAFGVDTRSLPIIAGCLLALVWATSSRRVLERHTRRFELVAVALFLAVVLVGWGNFYFAGPLLVVALCSCLLIARALDPDSPLTRALSVAPMVFLGRISYSLYLWHVPMLVAFGVFGAGLTLMAVPAVGLAIIAAVASYYLVELPFLRRKRRPASETEPTTNLTRPYARRESPLLGVPAADGLRSDSSAASA